MELFRGHLLNSIGDNIYFDYIRTTEEVREIRSVRRTQFIIAGSGDKADHELKNSGNCYREQTPLTTTGEHQSCNRKELSSGNDLNELGQDSPLQLPEKNAAWLKS